jgi:hypothetical protein
MSWAMIKAARAAGSCMTGRIWSAVISPSSTRSSSVTNTVEPGWSMNLPIRLTRSSLGATVITSGRMISRTYACCNTLTARPRCTSTPRRRSLSV